MRLGTLEVADVLLRVTRFSCPVGQGDAILSLFIETLLHLPDHTLLLTFSVAAHWRSLVAQQTRRQADAGGTGPRSYARPPGRRSARRDAPGAGRP
ncbi:hypothetical protein GCM10023075_80430 [Streptosporangium album]